jgi:hypothetical protein
MGRAGREESRGNCHTIERVCQGVGGEDKSHIEEAVENLDFSMKEFREMKMQPSLERALRHKEIMKA